jgi:hypothetical protein
MRRIQPFMILAAFILASNFALAQRPIISIGTTSRTKASISYNFIKGAGLRAAGGAMSSDWDSTGTSFTMNYNVSINNVTSISQFNVAGIAKTFITWPVNAFVKLRRNANSYVGDTSNHYNFWAINSLIPPPLAKLGIFNFIAPEITSPEDAFISNNINSGYDNIFQNTINYLHSGNIERVDFILPDGLKPAAYDLDNAGAAVVDRGVGDPFKIAAILSLDVNKNPLTYGPLVSVTTAQFGPALLATSFNYVIMVHDPKYGNLSRPSNLNNQNIRGVFMTLRDLGIAVNQRFYGYSLFGQDVVSANPNWRTYPTNSENASQLDPVNVMTIFKDVNSLLTVPLSLKLTKKDDKALLEFTIYDMINDYEVAIERSANGRDFNEIGRLEVTHTGDYYYTDAEPFTGITYYRLRVVEKSGSTGYSDIKTLRRGSTDGGVVLSPNPARDVIYINFPASWQQKQIKASLYDAAGALIQQTTFITKGREKNISIDKVQTGTYFLHLTNLFTHLSIVNKVMITQ